MTSTNRFDWRATAARPACFRPCPLERENPSMGVRDMRKFFNTPFSMTGTRRAFTPSLS